ncbi:MAG: tRNA (adenosine(37)-N6)-threonylcarbamoyltransferase complex transferase subunit TsaD [Bacteroidota bacterium]
MEKPINILGIESSCDDTSVSVIQNGKILTNFTANQNVHLEYGGVVPELASRAHQKNIVPVVSEAIRKAGIEKRDLNAIAYTIGPGLLGSLLVGSSFAKGMAASLNIPLLEINHMEAHILAHFINHALEDISFPFLNLTVSGGHTQLVIVENDLSMRVIGQTKDDAAGEAFDKCGKLLGLGYPAGPLLDRHAKSGNPKAFEFPKSSMQGFDYSFSGLKTAFLYFLRDEREKEENFIANNLNDLCASLQENIVDVLLSKLRKAARHHGIKSIGIAGGVSANSRLRSAFEELGKKEKWNTYIPDFEYCTDNGAMIAMSGYFKYQNQLFGSLRSKPLARLKI